MAELLPLLEDKSKGQKHNTNIQKLPINKLGVSEDAWLAGFIDADGYFGVAFRESRGKTYVGCQFELSQRTLCPKTGESYAPVIESIAEYFHVKVRIKKGKHLRYYLIGASSKKSKKIIRSYLDKFSLLSSKYLNYKDWCVVDVKNTMNNNRTEFYWDHLNQLETHKTEG